MVESCWVATAARAPETRASGEKRCSVVTDCSKPSTKHTEKLMTETRERMSKTRKKERARESKRERE